MFQPILALGAAVRGKDVLPLLSGDAARDGRSASSA